MGLVNRFLWDFSSTVGAGKEPGLLSDTILKAPVSQRRVGLGVTK